MIQCPKCSAPNPDGRTNCYHCNTPLAQAPAAPIPGAPYAPPAGGYPPARPLVTILEALSQWLHILGWVVLGLAAVWVIYIAAEGADAIATPQAGIFLLFLLTMIVMGLVYCVVLRALGSMMTLFAEIRDLLASVEANTQPRQSP